MTAGTAQRKARQADRSRTSEAMARVGLSSRAAVWAVVGLLALQLALGHHDEQADQHGALRAIAGAPLGGVLLVVLALGLAAYAAWRLLRAAGGHTDHEGAVLWVLRGAEVARAVVYLGLLASTLKLLVAGQDSGGGDARGPAARLMAQPGGRWLVLVIGVATAIGGLVMAGYAVAQGFVDRLEESDMSERERLAARILGTVGLASRGLVFAAIGGFVTQSAWTFDPNKAKGFSDSLRTLLQQPFGPALLVVLALGLWAFAAWSAVEARWREV